MALDYGAVEHLPSTSQHGNWRRSQGGRAPHLRIVHALVVRPADLAQRPAGAELLGRQPAGTGGWAGVAAGVR